MTVEFHTHYIYCASLLATVIVHAVLFHRGRLRILLMWGALAVLINIPWIVWLWDMKYGQRYGLFNAGTLFFSFFLKYFFLIGGHIFSPYLWLIIPLACIGSWIKDKKFFQDSDLFWKKMLLLLFFIIFNIGTLALISPFPFLRYITPLIPIVIIIFAVMLVAVAKVHLILPIVVVIILISTGNLGDFLYELTHDYDGPIEGIVKYLEENGNKDDVVAITYGDMPLKFYTQMRIVGGLTGEDLSPARQANWIILRKHTISNKDLAVRKYLVPILRRKGYQQVAIDYPDNLFENREDPAEHHFRTNKDEDRVVIFRKIQ